MRTTLTEADLRVIRLYAQGFYQKQVAEQLGLSEITVKQRTRIISERLGMPLYTRMSDILIRCLREGIINLGVTMKSETVQTITSMLVEQGGDWFCNPETYREFKDARDLGFGGLGTARPTGGIQDAELSWVGRGVPTAPLAVDKTHSGLRTLRRRSERTARPTTAVFRTLPVGWRQPEVWIA